MSLLKRAVMTPVVKRAVGRPRGSGRCEPKSTVCTWVPVRVHDRLIQIADSRAMSVSEYVKRVLIFAIKDESSGPPE